MNIRNLTIIFVLIILLSGIAGTNAGEITRDSSYTTAKGTKINMNATIQSDGEDSSGRPTMSVNSTYVFTIKISVIEVGADVEDIHDLAFQLSITADSLLPGSDLSYYQGYFLDKETKLQAGESHEYTFDMFISGGVGDTVATLKVEFSTKENVKDNVDPTVQYDAIQAEVAITGSVAATGLASGETLERSMEVFADKESKLRLEFFMTYEGQENETSKPEILSKTKYLMTYNITVLSLGTDAKDVHDVKVTAVLEDKSLTDIIPGNQATIYFAAGIEDTETNLVTDDVLTLHMVFYAATNINNTDVTLSIEYSMKENVQLIDPTSNFDLSVNLLLNKGISNVFDDLLSEGSDAPFIVPVIPIIIGLLVYRKKKQLGTIY